jgi:TonB family protein
MSCPDPYRPYNPFDEAQTSDARSAPHADLPSDAQIRGLTSALAASGGGDASEGLALDLVLNQIVEQACLATGATGAAIALTRGGEMVCRATTGHTAPDLGVRLDNAGFSAECLRVGMLQRCDDTETDPRVDAAACRLLGVRSILVVPLWYWGEFMGIFEIFSPRPNTFGERDEQTLQALAYRIVRHTKQAGGQLAGFSRAEDPEAAAAPAAEPEPTRVIDREPTRIIDPEPTHIIEEEPVRERLRPPIFELKPKAAKSRPRDAHDAWTTVLAACAGFIACAILSLMIWRLGLLHTTAQKAPAPAAPQSQEIDLGPMTAAAAPAAVAPSDPATQQTAPTEKPAPAAASKDSSAADLVVSASKKDVRVPAPPSGGLAIYDEKGKLIYGAPIHDQPAALEKPKLVAAAKLKPSTQLAKSLAPDANSDLIDGRFVRLKPELAENLLDARVEPDYPDAARRAHIQGSVVLETLIGADGRVQQVTPVSGNPQLADAAVTAVRQWRYKPFTVGGRKVPIRTQVNVTFMLAQ